MNEQKRSLKLLFDQEITKQIMFPNWNPYHKSSVCLSACLLCVSSGKMKDDKQWCDPNDKEVQVTDLPCFVSAHPTCFQAAKTPRNEIICDIDLNAGIKYSCFGVFFWVIFAFGINWLLNNTEQRRLHLQKHLKTKNLFMFGVVCLGRSIQFLLWKQYRRKV